MKKAEILIPDLIDDMTKDYNYQLHASMKLYTGPISVTH